MPQLRQACYSGSEVLSRVWTENMINKRDGAFEVPGRRLVFIQAEDGIRDLTVTGVQTCALPIYMRQDRTVFARRRVRQDGGGPVVGKKVVALNGVPEGDRARPIRGGEGLTDAAVPLRSEEGRVGKEGRSRWSPYHLKKKQEGGRA